MAVGASTQEVPNCWAALPLTSQGVVTADWEVEADSASDSVCLQLERTTVQVVVGGISVAQHSLIICRVNGHLQRKIICVLAAEVLAEGRASLLATSSSMHKEFTRETDNLSLPRSATRRIPRHRPRPHRRRPRPRHHQSHSGYASPPTCSSLPHLETSKSRLESTGMEVLEWMSCPLLMVQVVHLFGMFIT